jgi:hypothetical protein
VAPMSETLFLSLLFIVAAAGLLFLILDAFDQ